MQTLVRSVENTAIRSIQINIRSIVTLNWNALHFRNKESQLVLPTQNQKLQFHSTTPKQHLLGVIGGCLACTWSHYKMAEMGFLSDNERIMYYHVPGDQGRGRVIKYPYVPTWKYFIAGLFYPLSIPYYLLKPFIIQMMGYAAYEHFLNTINGKFTQNFSQNHRTSNTYDEHIWGDGGSHWSQWTWDPVNGWQESASQSNYSNGNQRNNQYTYRGSQNRTRNQEDAYKDYYADAQQFWEEFQRQYSQYYNQNQNSYNQNSYSNNSYRNYQSNSSSSGMTRAQAYSLLGLDYGASSAEINQAYKKMLMKYHPDHGGSTEMAAKINEARDVLLKH